jgi:WD40 repeat protein
MKHLATMDNNSLHVWERATGKRVHHIRRGGPEYFYGNLRFTPDSKTLVVTGPAAVHTYEVGTWKLTKHDLPEFKPASVGLHPCALSADGRIFVRPDWSGTSLKLWDWASRKPIVAAGDAKRAIGQMWPVAFSPDGKRIAGFTKEPKRLQVWSVKDMKLISEWKSSTDLDTLQFVEEGEFLVGAYHDSTVCTWNSSGAKERSRFQFPNVEYLSVIPAIAPNGKLVATADRTDNLVRIWELESHKEVGQFRGHVGPVYAIAFSPDSKVLAVSGNDTTVLLVNVGAMTGKEP